MLSVATQIRKVPTGDVLLALLTTELLATETAISRDLTAQYRGGQTMVTEIG
jgi:hypothetical protein